LIVTAALQKYADRGVFRGFSANQVRGGRYEYIFRWLAPRSFTLSYDPARRVLAFKSLFPRLAGRSAIVKELRALVDERATRRVPAHKRLDARKARASCAVRGGSFALTMTIAGRNEAYAVSQLLNLVNELFLVLHETYPDYLVAEFGLSAE
jgi:hypothetical protein